MCVYNFFFGCKYAPKNHTSLSPFHSIPFVWLLTKVFNEIRPSQVGLWSLSKRQNYISIASKPIESPSLSYQLPKLGLTNEAPNALLKAFSCPLSPRQRNTGSVVSSRWSTIRNRISLLTSLKLEGSLLSFCTNTPCISCQPSFSPFSRSVLRLSIVRSNRLCPPRRQNYRAGFVRRFLLFVKKSNKKNDYDTRYEQINASG